MKEGRSPTVVRAKTAQSHPDCRAASTYCLRRPSRSRPLRSHDYVAQSHTPQAHCVRFGRAVTGRTRNTRYRAARYALPGRDLPPQDRADFAQRTATSIGISTASVFSPLTAAKPTFALKACAWFRWGRFVICAPDSGDHARRCQAENPLNTLFRFAWPALSRQRASNHSISSNCGKRFELCPKLAWNRVLHKAKRLFDPSRVRHTYNC